MKFTPSGYVEMVAQLLARGYEIQGFDSFEPDQPHLILRHDIDFDPDAAVVFGQIEADHGWRSHYFALTGSEFYNLSGPRCRAAIRKLRDLGHNVGLHFDASQYVPEHAALIAAVHNESAVIEKITGTPAKVFSLHRPHPDLLDATLTVPGRLNAYGPSLFRDIGYVSDSRGAWQNGSPLAHKAVADGHALQLLTHPIWWTSDPDLSPHEKCAAFLARRANRLDAEMALNCSAYQGGGVRAHDGN